MSRRSSSSSGEEVYWERKRGGSEMELELDEPPIEDTKKNRRRRRETHKPQEADKYYHIQKHKPKKEASRIESLVLEKPANQIPTQKDGKKDEPPVYPEYELTDPKDDGDEDDSSFSDHSMNYIILGYIVGIIMVLLFYQLSGEEAHNNLNKKFYLIVFLVLLILVICFSQTTRCITALLVTLLFGYRGGLLMMSLAFYLALTGPIPNILRNIEIMTHSLGCGLGLLSNALTPMHQIIAEPIYIVEQSIFNCLSQVRQLTEPLDDVLRRLETPIIGLYSGYRICGEWLRHQQNFFDNQMGTPYDRCMGAGSISAQECRSKFSDDKSVCNIEPRIDWFCSNLKDLGSFFDPKMQQNQQITEQLFTRPLESFDKIRSLFAASITFDHVQKNEGETREKSINELDLEIGKVWDFEMKLFMVPYIWLYIMVVVLIVLVLMKAIYFRVNYLGSVNFRNMYLTKEFYAYNIHQQYKLGYSALPLRWTEMKHFTKLFSCRYLPFEIEVVYHPLMFMVITSLQLFVICFVDYSLFWMLAIMSYHAHQTADLPTPEYTKILVEGGGMIGFILQGLVKAFEPLSRNLFADVQHCLPLPGPPKYMRYWEILMICIVAWVLMFFEPFVLRLRHLIMSHFYPGNAELRAEYLHHSLLRNREIFILAVRRKARASNLYVYENWFIKIDHKFDAFLYWITCGLFGSYKSLKCTICHAKLTEADCVECETINCRGVYCQTCFIESNCHCILCNPPNVYGDYSTYSEVDDSSDDPDPDVYPFRPHRLYCGPPLSERDKSV